jgi:hypothetical protein
MVVTLDTVPLLQINKPGIGPTAPNGVSLLATKAYAGQYQENSS